MPAKPSASLFDAMTSMKGAALLVPAILLVGATLAVGRQRQPSASAPPAPAATTEQASPQPAARQRHRKRRMRRAPDGFTAAQRKELEAIIKDFLLNNPEIMLEVQNALEAKMDKIQAERMAVAIKENATELFRPAGSPDRRQRQGRRDGHRVLRLQLRLLQEGASPTSPS